MIHNSASSTDGSFGREICSISLLPWWPNRRIALSITFTISIIMDNYIQLAGTYHVLGACKGSYNSMWYRTKNKRCLEITSRVGCCGTTSVCLRLISTRGSQFWQVVDSIFELGYCCGFIGMPEHMCSKNRCFSRAHRYPRS